MMFPYRDKMGMGMGTLKTIFWSVLILVGVAVWRAGLLA
jgi:hypothetical protein